MNKLNNSLILVILIISIIFTNGEEKVFLNFVPYLTSNCEGNPHGLGYGAIVNTCFTLDNGINWLFKVSSKGKGLASWTGFENVYGSEECNTVLNETVQHNVGDCVSGSDIIFDSNYFQIKDKHEKSSIFYKLLVTVNQPYIPSNSYVNLYMYNECLLSDYSVLVEYFTNSTTIGYVSKGDTRTFSCIDKVPYSVYCFGTTNTYCRPPSYEAVDCSEYQLPFFNSSSENYPPNNTGGPWTDHATTFVSNHNLAPGTSGSGTGSGSNSAVASSSSSGSANSGVPGGLSTDASYGSSTSQLYYISTYCT